MEDSYAVLAVILVLTAFAIVWHTMGHTPDPQPTSSGKSVKPQLPKEPAIYVPGRGWVLPASAFSDPLAPVATKVLFPSGPIVLLPAPPNKTGVSPTPRTHLTRSIRKAVFSRDGYKCKNCGASGKTPGVQLVIDHKKPLKRGGTNGMENLQTLCSPCNAKKGVRNTGYGDVSRQS